MKLSIKQRIALELARGIKNNRKKLHPLSQLFWECTLRCNLSCRHCGSSCGTKSSVPDMPAEDFLKVVDSITPFVDNHELMIIITGGEPLLRRDLEYVGKQLYNREFPWGIVSNGMLLNSDRLNALIDSGMRSVTISLDGNEDDHNLMRGNSESWKSAFEAIKLLGKTNNLNWDVATCVTPKSLVGLQELKTKLFDNGVKNWRVFSAFPAGRAALNNDLQLSGNQLQKLLNFIIDCRNEGKHVSYSCEGFLGSYEGLVRDYLYSCEAGVSVASVMCNGDISACPGIRANFAQGNIYKDDFWTVWNTGFQKFRNRDWTKIGKCATCNYFRYCDGGGMHLHNSDNSLMMCHIDILQNS